MDRIIQVEGPTDQLVTIYRGVERESYSCMPICQRRVTLGDGESLLQIGDRQAGDAQRPGQRAQRPRQARPALRAMPPTGGRFTARQRAMSTDGLKTRLTARVRGLLSHSTKHFHNQFRLNLAGKIIAAALGIPRCRRPLLRQPPSEHWRRFRRNRRGSAAVEFALVAPVFFALLFAIIETALMFFASQVLETVTQESATPDPDRAGAGRRRHPQAQFKQVLSAIQSRRCSIARIFMSTSRAYPSCTTWSSQPDRHQQQFRQQHALPTPAAPAISSSS